MLKIFIRNEKNGQPRGIAVAVRDGNEVTYGYSLVNTRMDRFDKNLGLKIALARATSTKGYQLPVVPEREALVVTAFAKLQERSLKYFKDVPPENITVFELLDKEYDALQHS